MESDKPVIDGIEDRPWETTPAGNIVVALNDDEPLARKDWSLSGGVWECLDSDAMNLVETVEDMRQQFVAAGATFWRPTGYREAWLVAEGQLLSTAHRADVEDEDEPSGFRAVDADVVHRQEGWTLCSSVVEVRDLARQLDWSDETAQLTVRRVVMTDEQFEAVPVRGKTVHLKPVEDDLWASADTPENTASPEDVAKAMEGEFDHDDDGSAAGHAEGLPTFGGDL